MNNAKLSQERKLATEKNWRLKADVSSVCSSSIRSDEGLTLEISTFKLFTMANFSLSTQLIILNYPEKRNDW